MDNKRKIEKILDRGEKSAWKWAKKKGFEKGWPEIPARAASIASVLDVVSKVEIADDLHLTKEDLLRINFLVGKNSYTPLLVSEIPYSNRDRAGVCMSLETVYTEPEDYYENDAEYGECFSGIGMTSLQLKPHTLVPQPVPASYAFSSAENSFLVMVGKEMMILAISDQVCKDRDLRTVNLMKKLSLMNPGMEVVVENVEQNIWKSIIRGIRQQETNLYIERKRLPDMGLLTSVKIKNFLAMSPLFVPDASSLRTGSIYLAGYFDAKPVYVATGFGDEILLFPLPSLHGLIEERSGILTCSAAYLIWQENRWVAHETYSVTDESFYSLVRVVVKDIWYRKLLAWIKSRF